MLIGSALFSESEIKMDICLEKIRQLCPEMTFLGKVEALVKEIMSNGILENINYFYNSARVFWDLHITDYKKSEFEENYFRNLITRNT